MSKKKFKIVIFGDGGVGKTTLVNRYLTGIFTQGSMTIGVDFHIKVVDIKGVQIVLQIWDYAGQDRFRFLFPSYAKDSDGAIFMYDITRYSSIKSVSDWLDSFNSGVILDIKDLPLIMVGGKKDLETSRSVSLEEAINLSKKNEFREYIECSSKTGENVETIFNRLSYLLLKKAGMI